MICSGVSVTGWSLSGYHLMNASVKFSRFRSRVRLTGALILNSPPMRIISKMSRRVHASPLAGESSQAGRPVLPVPPRLRDDHHPFERCRSGGANHWIAGVRFLEYPGLKACRPTSYGFGIRGQCSILNPKLLGLEMRFRLISGFCVKCVYYIYSQIIIIVYN